MGSEMCIRDRQRIEDVEHESMQNGRAWHLLSAALSVSAAFALLSLFFPVCYAVPIFDIVGFTLTRWGWWFTPSFSYIGQGMIMGFDTSKNMALGSLFGWGILGPIAQNMGWAHGEPLDGMTGARGWIVWVAVAIMCAESVTGIAALGLTHFSTDLLGWVQCTTTRIQRRAVQLVCPRCKCSQCPGCSSSDAGGSTADAARSVKPHYVADDGDDEPPERLTSSQWIIYGLVISTVAGLSLIHI